MFVRRLLIVLCLCFFSVSAQASSWCKMSKKANIRISPEMSKIRYDYSKSFLELSNVQLASQNPYGSKAITHTFGIANGQFNIEHLVKFQILTNPNTNESCLWYDTVTVKMKMKPVIMIANEYRKGGCHFREVMTHEMQHIAVDKQVTNQYAQKLGQDLLREVNRKAIYGPFPTAQKNKIQQQIQKRLNQIVKANNTAMMSARSQRQSVIDSKSNYDAVGQKIERCDQRSPITAKRVQRKIER